MLTLVRLLQQSGSLPVFENGYLGCVAPLQLAVAVEYGGEEQDCAGKRI